MKAYKGFDKDLKCRGFQFEVGGEYFEEKAKLCKSGFHACENPLEVLSHYDPANSRYCEVELDQVSDECSNNSKVCGKRIHIYAEIGLNTLISDGVRFILNKVDFDGAKESNTGFHSAATNTGNYSAATNTGNHSAATNTGSCSVATNTGNYSAATNTGNYSAATNTGNHSAATNTGSCSAATNTGNYSAAVVEGKDSVAFAVGFKCKAKASIGSAICVAERGAWDGKTYPLLSVRAAIVDGEVLKPDTFYALKNGKFVIAEEEHT